MKHYILSEKELREAGLNPEKYSRTWISYVVEDLEADIEAEKIEISDENGNLLNAEEIIDIAKTLDMMEVSDSTNESVVEDMQYDLQEHFNNLTR